MKKVEKQKRSYETIKFSFENNVYSLKVNSIVTDKIRKVNCERFIDFKQGTIIIKPQLFNIEFKVPNVYRYSINKERELMCFVEKTEEYCKSAFKDRSIEVESETKSIVLLLESPHKLEYDYKNNFSVKGPAQGRTGQLIESKIMEILKNIDLPKNEELKIILVNPIPYQTSLHYLHRGSLSKSYFKHLRDIVWLNLWENESTFKNELEKLLFKLKPLVILNACTKELKDPLNVFLINKGWKDKVFLTNHPSNWWKEIKCDKLIAP